MRKKEVSILQSGEVDSREINVM